MFVIMFFEVLRHRFFFPFLFYSTYDCTKNYKQMQPNSLCEATCVATWLLVASMELYTASFAISINNAINTEINIHGLLFKLFWVIFAYYACIILDSCNYHHS